MKPTTIVEFSISGAKDIGDGWVFCPAPVVFECGDYPDKDFSLSKDEAKKAVASFKPVPLDLEHKKTVLDGKLGKLVAVHFDDSIASGKGGLGKAGVIIPEWLNKTLDTPERRKLSLTFNKATKEIIGCAFTHNPRISNAGLIAEFVCNEAIYDKEAKATKVAFDMMTTHTPEITGTPTVEGEDLIKHVCDMIDKALSNSNKSIHSAKYLKALEKIKTICSGFKSGEKDESGDAAASDKDDESDADDKVNYTKQLEADLARERSERTRERVERVKVDAANFADREIMEKRAMPFEQEGLVRTYVALANADEVTFSATKAHGVALSEFVKQQRGRPKLDVDNPSNQRLGGGGVVIPATFADQTDKPDPNNPVAVPQSRIDALLSLTPEGRDIIAARSKK